jgi:hypothetical protein
MTTSIAGVTIVERNVPLVTALFFFTTLSFIAVVLRTITRAALVRNFGRDDSFIVVASIAAIGFLTATLYQIKYGLGDAVLPETLISFLQSLYFTILCYGVSHLSVKFSILFQCRRIFVERSAQRIYLGLLVWMTLYGLFCLLSSIFTCVPAAKYWDASIEGGCMDRSALHYALAAFNIANDITLLILPLPYLRALQIPKRARYMLMGVFACGSFACIVAIIRLYSLWVFNSVAIDQQPIKGVDIALWSGLEINVAIVCASVPALKPLFVKFFPRFFSSISSFTDSNKPSRYGDRYGRSTHRSIPLHSFSRKEPTSTVVTTTLPADRDDSSTSDGGIKVQQSFEMKAVSANGDNDSEINLVTTSGRAGHSRRSSERAVEAGLAR